MYMIFILTASKWWSNPPTDIHIHAAINASIKFISGDTSDYISGQVNSGDIQSACFAISKSRQLDTGNIIRLNGSLGL